MLLQLLLLLLLLLRRLLLRWCYHVSNDGVKVTTESLREVCFIFMKSSNKFITGITGFANMYQKFGKGAISQA